MPIASGPNPAGAADAREAQRVGAGQDGEPEGQCHTEEADPCTGVLDEEDAGQHRAAAAAEHEPQRAQHLRDRLALQVHRSPFVRCVLPLVRDVVTPPG
jgi:hypothetical protein